MSEEIKPVVKDPIVLDAEGHVLHDPKSGQAFETRVYQFNGSGILPKIFIGAVLGGLLLLGLTIAGVVLGVLFLGFIGRLLFFGKSKLTRR